MAWYENDGSQNFATHILTTAAEKAYAVLAADVDGDGDIDILSASASFEDEVAWYENDGNQNFTAHIITTLADGANSVFVSDLDGDGDADVLSSSREDDTVAWYENDGAQNFVIRTITTVANGARMAIAADVDGDGDLDVLSASVFDDTLAWYENDGSQGFTTHTISTGIDGVGSLITADLDADGDLDVLAPSPVSDEVLWYENRGGQFALPTTDDAPSLAAAGASVSILEIDATHRGRIGDTAVELVTFDLLFEEMASDSFTSAEANALIENLDVYIDTGSGTFESGSDALVTTVATLSLTAGRQTVSFSDGDANVQVAFGTPRKYFVVADLTANAHSQAVDNFRISHVTSSTSTGEDSANDIPVSLEFATDVASTVVEVNDPPVATPDAAPSVNEDGVLLVPAPGVMGNDTDEEGDAVAVLRGPAPASAASFSLGVDGSYSYIPNSHFSGADSFSYRLEDPLASSSTVVVSLNVVAVADAPNLSVNDAVGAVDTAIALSIAASLVDTDGSETLSITIMGVPEGAALSAGADQGDGMWLLTPGDLTGLTITPPSGSDVDFMLGVQATATETSNNSQASTLETLLVVVGVADNLIFADGFESGDTSAWSSTITNPVVLAVTVANEASYEPGVYRGRFLLNPEDFSKAESDVIYEVRQWEGQTSAFGLRVTRTADGYAVHGWVSGADEGKRSRDLILLELPYELEFEQAEESGLGAANGYLRIFVDGLPAGSLENLGPLER